MEHRLFPSIPNTAEVNDLKDFCWVVTTGRSITVRHGSSKEEVLELLTPEPAGTATWMGDLLSWAERGEFIMAVGHGLVACVAVRGVRIRGERDESSGQTFRVEGPNGKALVRVEWDSQLEFTASREGWLEVLNLDSDVPLMVYVQAADPEGDEGLTHKKLERFERTDLGALVTHVQKYQNDLPLWQTEPDLEALWNFGLHLHRASTYGPQPPFSFEWECACRTVPQQSGIHGGRHTLQVVWDWLFLNPDRARQEFANYMRSFDEETGMMAGWTSPAEEGGRAARQSHPPVWPHVAWQLYLVLRDRNFLEELLRTGLLNVGWWEQNRRGEGEVLFGYAEASESGYEGSPRFDRGGAPTVSIDLSCQMALFYLSLKRFAGQLGETALARDLQGRYEKLAERIRTKLWDEKTGFFYDRRKGRLVRVKTAGAFFSMLAGVASDEQVAALCEHVASDREFLRRFPVPAVAADDPAFAKEGWRGLSSLSETLWTVAALRRGDRPRVAAQITRRALDGAAEVLRREGTVFEFYNPDGPEQEECRGIDGSEVARYHVGNAPVHALAALGLYGIEMTRDGLVVDPVGAALPEQSAIEVQLPEMRLTVLVRRTDALDGIELKVREGRKVLGEGFGRTVIGAGKLM